jgi:hypothetical protein
VHILCVLQGSATYADFSAGGWHPQSFKAQNITPALVQRMRGGGYIKEVQPAAVPETAAAFSTDEDQAAALADAIDATIAEAEADVVAASAAAAAKAAQQDLGMQPEQPTVLPPCEVDAAMHSAAKLFITAARRNVPDPSAVPDHTAASDVDGGVRGRGLHSLPLHILHGLSNTRQQQRQLLVVDNSGASEAHLRVKGTQWIVAAGYAPLASHCPLFARKFTAAVTNHTLAMALSCAGIGLGSWCSA